MKNSAVLLVFFALVVAAQGLPDCTQSDSPGCTQWESAGYCDSSSPYHSFMQQTCGAACGLCQALPPPPPQNVNVDSAACLAAHNDKRSLHGVPNLSWDANLATGAAAWALHLAQTNTFDHSSADNYGENLYSATASTVKTCSDAVQLWYDEINNYDFNNPAINDNTGHFTQVVWKSTTALGVGIATATVNGYTKTFVVARYTPAGNVPSQLSENVLPLV